MYSTSYCCHILIRLELSRNIEKFRDIKFQENPSLAKQLLNADRRTDREMDRHE
jgi:hypothetical protein